MICVTYLLQGGSLVLMVLSVYLMAECIRGGDYALFAINMALFFVNVCLFYWNGNIRSELR